MHYQSLSIEFNEILLEQFVIEFESDFSLIISQMSIGNDKANGSKIMLKKGFQGINNMTVLRKREVGNVTDSINITR